MGNGIGKLSPCFAGDAGDISRRRHHISVYLSDPLDEGLGHSFCYIRPDLSNLSTSAVHSEDQTTTFKSISGASISANTSTPLSTSIVDLGLYNNVIDKASAFESSNSFSAIPLQPIPKNSIQSLPISKFSGTVWSSGPIERGFLSGPIERSFISCPIERSFISGPLEHQTDQLQRYKPKTKKWVLLSVLKKAISKSIIVPIRGAKELGLPTGLEKKIDTLTLSGTIRNNLSSQVSSSIDEDDELFGSQNLQWAQGKAGEDRVHIVVSEGHGWVFVGIYDGFNGPDATDFLVHNLYSNIHRELKGLLWNDKLDSVLATNPNSEVGSVKNHEFDQSQTFEDEDFDLGCDSNRQSQRRWKCHCDRGRLELDRKLKEQIKNSSSDGSSGINHPDVLKALSEALRKTEKSFLEIADLMLKENPELSLMGSCVLVMLIKGDDVYLMNVGDSRAVIAQKSKSDLRVNEKKLNDLKAYEDDHEFESLGKLNSLQLTMDHSTSVEQEVRRIKSEHRNDPYAIANERVKGSLKVTRAFGAGFLKQPKWNNALLEMFRIDYVGTASYINCFPSLYHHRLSSRDRFLILSSDGLYQYFTNEEAVSEVEMFITSFPEGDPAQHLVEEVLFRAAKKAGMDFHELLEIPQGDRRKYHDDVSIIIISLEGRIWRSSV